MAAMARFCALVLLSVLSLSKAFLRCPKGHIKGLTISSNTREVSKLSARLDEYLKLASKVVLPVILSSVLIMAAPLASNAYWNESGEWIELKESSVTEVWGDRLKKAATMSPSDIFMAAKGAGNNDKR